MYYVLCILMDGACVWFFKLARHTYPLALMILRQKYLHVCKLFCFYY